MKSWVRYDDEWVDIHPKQGMLAMPVDSSLYDGVYVVKHAHGKYVDLVWYRQNSEYTPTEQAHYSMYRCFKNIYKNDCKFFVDVEEEQEFADLDENDIWLS